MKHKFEKDSPIKHPPDGTVIWRYLDMAKYINLVQSKKLYFCRVDKLEDKKEGILPEGQSLHKKFVLQRRAELAEFYEQLESFYQKWVKATYVNCWNMSDYESNLMWKFYVNNNHGVSIRSTYGKLKDSIDYASPQIFTIGCVEYYNPLKHGKDIGNTIRPFVYKTSEYTSENEIRAIVQHGPTKDDPKMEKTPENYFLGVDLDILIDEIVISPWSPKWHIEIYEELNGKFGISKNIRPSTLE